MKKITKENLPFKVFTLPREEAKQFMAERGASYKVAVAAKINGVWTAMCVELCARGLLSLGVLIWRGEELYKKIS